MLWKYGILSPHFATCYCRTAHNTTDRNPFVNKPPASCGPASRPVGVEWCKGVVALFHSCGRGVVQGRSRFISWQSSPKKYFPWLMCFFSFWKLPDAKAPPYAWSAEASMSSVFQYKRLLLARAMVVVQEVLRCKRASEFSGPFWFVPSCYIFSTSL